MKNRKKGVTLMEVLIYLALFSILMSGAFIGAYNVVESNERNRTKVMLQEEGNFLLSKISWVLSGVSSVSIPADNTSATSLSVAKWDSAVGNPLRVDLNGKNLTLTRGNNPPQILNNSNVWLTNVVFSHHNQAGIGLNPEDVTVSFTLVTRTPTGIVASLDFSSTNFLRR